VAGATLQGYTVVVAEDGISSAEGFATFLTRYQLRAGGSYSCCSSCAAQF
jgi:hypothetical protein